jgi:hypothetical protein
MERARQLECQTNPQDLARSYIAGDAVTRLHVIYDLIALVAAIACVVSALKEITFPSPGSYPSKGSLTID